MLAIGSALVAQPSHADMYDVLMPHYVAPAACQHGCAPWASVPSAQWPALWAKGAPPPNASNACAIPAAAVDEGEQDPATHHCGGGALGHLVCNGTTSSFYGPICACAPSPGDAAEPHAALVFATCTAPVGYPEQINLQIAASGTVVVSFVTFEPQLPAAPPTAELRAVGGGAPQTLAGVAHRYTSSHAAHSQSCDGSSPSSVPCARRNYIMSFVKLSRLAPRQRYEYRVKSGGEGAQWSELFEFRALYLGGGGGGAGNPGHNKATRVAVYGDMGNTLHNNMANLKADCDAETIDAIVHLGDHCYDLSMGNDLHGDAYMNAFEPTLATCPWLPVIGNHESTAGAGGDRVDLSSEEHYLNQTFGVVMSSTANSSLGHLLTKGSFYGSGSHGAAPSRTSQWASVDVGLVHFAVLDLDPGPPPVFAGAQAAWLEADLAKAGANRHNVPWIVVGSHFPLYAGRFEEDGALNASLDWYVGEESEAERGDRPWRELPSLVQCGAEEHTAGKCATVADALNVSKSALEPLLAKYGVDIYIAGHVHSYSVSWPLFDGAVTAKNYDEPQGVVHVLEGNGGVPNHDASSPAWKNALHQCGGELYRICGTGGAYGRLIAHNASVLQYEHVENPTGRVGDTWAITRKQPRESAR